MTTTDLLHSARTKTPEFLQETLDAQRVLSETLLTVAQYETDDLEKRAILDELEE